MLQSTPPMQSTRCAFAAFVLAVSAFSACESEPEPVDNRAGNFRSSGGPAGPDETGQIAGLPAADFYADLAYPEQGTQGPVLTARIHLDNDTDQRLAALALYLLPHSTFRLFYREHAIVLERKGALTPDAPTLLDGREFGGSWQVDGTTLVLGDIATATGLGGQDAGGRPSAALKVHFLRDAGTPGLAGQDIVLSATTTATSPDEAGLELIRELASRRHPERSRTDDSVPIKTPPLRSQKAPERD